MDAGLLAVELERCARRKRLPLAVIPTDLYGQCCELGRIVEICDRYGVPVICDSAEALGARYRSRVQGAGGRGQERKFEEWAHAGVGGTGRSIFSFNGNKIITTSGGGMLASDDEELILHAKKLSQQARGRLSPL